MLNHTKTAERYWCCSVSLIQDLDVFVSVYLHCVGRDYLCTSVEVKDSKALQLLLQLHTASLHLLLRGLYQLCPAMRHWHKANTRNVLQLTDILCTANHLFISDLVIFPILMLPRLICFSKLDFISTIKNEWFFLLYYRAPSPASRTSESLGLLFPGERPAGEISWRCLCSDWNHPVLEEGEKKRVDKNEVERKKRHSRERKGKERKGTRWWESEKIIQHLIKYNSNT